MALKIFEKFSPRANPADTDYPYGSIKNESVPGAKDGTPLDASWGNDMLGFTDALLGDAGITPNGLPDTAQSSQRLEALKTVVRKLLELNSIKDTLNLSLSIEDGQRVGVKSFWAGLNVGGGVFHWDASKPKTEHNGGTIIDPDKTGELGALGVFGSYFTPAVSGTGCFVRANGIPVLKAELYIENFGAINDGGVTDNYLPLKATKEAANLVNGKVVLGAGGTGYASTLQLDTERTSIIGIPDQPDQRGSDLPASTLIWTGGAAPMISSSSSYHLFNGFAVSNKGTATQFLELNSGSIGNRYRRMDFLLATGDTQFSECVIKSNGNRIGYSVFSNIQIKGCADVFLLVDGQGSSNAITPVTFNDRCIVESTVSDFTLLKIIDEKIETVNIRDCTFNQQTTQMTIVDTTQSPLSSTIDALNFEGSEVDIQPSNASASQRVFRLTNVENINMRGNTLSLGGQATAMCDLVNSHVANFEGNYYRALNGSIFNPDSTSTVNEGVNVGDASNTDGVVKVKTASITETPYSAVMLLDGYTCQSKGGHVFEVEVTDSAGYQFRVSNTKPNYMRIGQVFTLVVKNVSGGAISAGAFGTGFTANSPTAPSNGNSMAYTFYFDGTTAREISRLSSEIPN